MTQLKCNNGMTNLEGELSFTTISSLREQGNKFIKDYSEVIFDLKAVSRCDSSATALLIAWQRYAVSLHKKVKFINMPDKLLEIIRLANLQKILLGS